MADTHGIAKYARVYIRKYTDTDTDRHTATRTQKSRESRGAKKRKTLHRGECFYFPITYIGTNNAINATHFVKFAKKRLGGERVQKAITTLFLHGK